MWGAPANQPRYASYERQHEKAADAHDADLYLIDIGSPPPWPRCPLPATRVYRYGTSRFALMLLNWAPVVDVDRCWSACPTARRKDFARFVGLSE